MMKAAKRVAVCVVMLSWAVASARVVQDPPLRKTVDVAGEAGDVTGACGASKSKLLRVQGLKVVSVFNGFENVLQNGGHNGFDFSDGADIQLTVSGESLGENSGGQIVDSRYASSDEKAIILRGKAAVSRVVLDLDFGEYRDGSFEADCNAVEAVGFVVTRILDGQTVVVRFFNSDGAVLAEQRCAGSETPQHLFFSYVGDGTWEEAVSRVQVIRSSIAAGGQISGVDDIAFGPVVPGPGE